MSKLGLSPEEEIQIKTICEYLFFDEFKDYVSYNRLEQCFQPLFNNIQISIDRVFKSICGEKKKYINYQRLINSYLLYKGNDPKLDPDLKTFFDKLFNSILKKENSLVGKPQENAFTFSTSKSCQKRECISTIKILSDKEDRIHGLIIEYDDGIAKNELYTNIIEDSLEISLEMKLGIIDEKLFKDKKEGKLAGIKGELYKDAVTHVFGCISQKTGFVTFLGFKCVSGKTVFAGFPEGDGFLFGIFGKKFHEIKLQMSLEGIFLLQPRFNDNKRTNFFLSTEADNLTKEDLKKDFLIQDEVQLSQIDNAAQIDKLITIPIIEENHFLNEKIIDELSGKDYKEVVNQYSREWILKDPTDQNKKVEGILTVDDALKQFEKEKENSKKQLDAIKLEEMGHEGDKKKKRTTKGKLSETKPLVEKMKNILNNKENIKYLKPISILKNKDLYRQLKEKVGQGIRDELIKLKEEFSSDIGQAIINQIISDQENLTKEKEIESESEENLIPKKKKKRRNKKTRYNINFKYSN